MRFNLKSIMHNAWRLHRKLKGTVSARLGHSQTSTTMNVYVHALEEADQKSADALETMLRKQA